jgi:hypothetical protein
MTFGLLFTTMMPTEALSRAAAAGGGGPTPTAARASEGGDAPPLASLGTAPAPVGLKAWASAPAADLEVAVAAAATDPPSARASWAGSAPRPSLAGSAASDAGRGPGSDASSRRPLSPAAAAPRPRPTLGQKLATVARDPDAALFFATAAAFGVGVGTVDSWLFVALDERGASRTLMSMTLVVTVAAEVPVFFFAGRLVDALGVSLVLHGVYAAFLVRLVRGWGGEGVWTGASARRRAPPPPVPPARDPVPRPPSPGGLLCHSLDAVPVARPPV